VEAESGGSRQLEDHVSSRPRERSDRVEGSVIIGRPTRFEPPTDPPTHLDPTGLDSLGMTN
jgi:hypothetical protein